MGVSSSLEVCIDRVKRLLPDRDDPLFASLAPDADEPIMPVNVVMVHADEFASTDSGRIECFEDRSVAVNRIVIVVHRCARSFHQSLRVVYGQHCRESLLAARCAYEPCGIREKDIFTVQIFKKGSESRQLACDRCFLRFIFQEKSDELPERLVVYFSCVHAIQEIGELQKVREIAPLGMSRNVFFDLEVTNEIEDILPHAGTLS